MPKVVQYQIDFEIDDSEDRPNKSFDDIMKEVNVDVQMVLSKYHLKPRSDFTWMASWTKEGYDKGLPPISSD